ncbi:histidine phosphatase family protein [Amnibacterium endophyticum]|uniref:Histidine phosphatase family protein n=1 Tax=Amnibacterium endophyticum TaxID=2109337 RepID=A0ABW4LEF3_9MICO
MVRLILVRHGQSESNVAALLDSAEPGAPLSALGRQQAAELPARFAEERIERVVASPLARTVATARPLADALGLPLPVDAGLREVLSGDLEMRGDRDAHLAYLDPVFRWMAGDLAARVPGSPEDGRDFLARYDRAVEAAVQGAVGAVVLASHGAAIRAWAGIRAANLPDDHGRERGLPNTGVVVLEGAPGAWRATEWQGERFTDVDDDPTGAGVPG